VIRVPEWFQHAALPAEVAEHGPLSCIAAKQRDDWHFGTIRISHDRCDLLYYTAGICEIGNDKAGKSGEPTMRQTGSVNTAPF
jgi:hypothetical protein